VSESEITVSARIVKTVFEMLTDGYRINALQRSMQFPMECSLSFSLSLLPPRPHQPG
jgi:hypothetical protein